MSVELSLKELQSQTSRSSSPALCLSVTIDIRSHAPTKVRLSLAQWSASRLSVQAGREFELRKAPWNFTFELRQFSIKYESLVRSIWKRKLWGYEISPGNSTLVYNMYPDFYSILHTKMFINANVFVYIKLIVYKKQNLLDEQHL